MRKWEPWDDTVTRWRIYADTDFLYSTQISMYPVIYPSHSTTLLKCIRDIQNKYIFYYVLAF